MVIGFIAVMSLITSICSVVKLLLCPCWATVVPVLCISCCREHFLLFKMARLMEVRLETVEKRIVVSPF